MNRLPTRSYYSETPGEGGEGKVGDSDTTRKRVLVPFRDLKSVFRISKCVQPENVHNGSFRGIF